MSILFENCDLLLRGEDGVYSTLHGFLGVRGDTIDYIGTEKPTGEYEEHKSMDHKLLMPGLINCHNHSPMVLLRGVGSGLLAIIIERLVYSPLRKRHAPSLYFIISAMGASIFLENFVIATIDGTPRNYPPIFDNRINIGGISLGVDSLLMIVVSAVALLILMFIIQKTKVGLAIRACSYSEKASTLMGINGDLVIFIIFLMGGVLAGFAGMLYGMRFIVRPTIGQVTNKSFVAAVFGGLGSLPGAIVGSVLLGIMEIFVASFNSNLRDLFVYGLLILVLIIKPSGLMGKVVEDKA